MAVRWTTVAAGIGVVIVIIAVVVILKGLGDVSTPVLLRDNAQGECVVVQKEPEVRIKKDKKITWEIQNECTNSNERVTVGNFRTVATSTATHCQGGIEGAGVTWPFKEDPNDLSRRQGTQKIELHIKRTADLPAGTLTYYYDICTGANAERKSDPRLVIEE